MALRLIATLIAGIVMSATGLAQTTSHAEIPGEPDFRPYVGEQPITTTFRGSDVLLLNQYLVEANKRSEKGEFESTAEFEARSSNLTKALALIDDKAFYAFPLHGVSANYEADREIWTVVTDSVYGCTPYPGQADLLECLSVLDRTKSESYVGQNGFGAQAVIERVFEHDIRFVIARNWPQTQALFSQGTFGHYGLSLDFSMPIAEARQLGRDDIRVFAIGTIVAPTIRREREKYSSPNINDPTRLTSRATTLPMLAQQSVVVAKGRAGALSIVSLSGKALTVP